METLQKSIGDRLRLARLERRVRQVDVAIRLGLSPSVISAVENNYRHPTRDLVRRMCEVIGVEAEDVES